MTVAVQESGSSSPEADSTDTSPNIQIEVETKGAKQNTRVYISNINFKTTEDNLINYLNEYKVKTVLVPSHTVRGFKSQQQRPLGIAYAEFEAVEDAQKVCEELNGKEFQGRKLKIKPYVPYSPKKLKRKSSRFHKISNSADSSPVSPQLDCSSDPDPASGSDNLASGSSTASPDSNSPELSSSSNEVSDNTIFIGRLNPKVTDTDLRAFFNDYNPSEIYIFRGKYNRRRLRFGYHIAALVTVSGENAQKDALDNLSGKKLNNKVVKLAPAYLSKIEEVKNALKAHEESLRRMKQKEREEHGYEDEEQEDENEGENEGEVEDEDEKQNSKSEKQPKQENGKHRDSKDNKLFHAESAPDAVASLSAHMAQKATTKEEIKQIEVLKEASSEPAVVATS
ncbi:Rrt5p ASCRUDRAFT_70844 [Ascoidea rubescens DSM 1968]|uniref:Regulator of rDNA transcription protein 5 n=1 Tax=Ascoidea rubescens DSM 1968 TaxID=1344418 RepID=A0A1D2VFR3_9ASCO|nr:hypothetical protein ASCRUDRAFT_70844 [Ascoidea rubescens DSM 1968]ODV60317.1 hypothetical protein ASCRUDRAFT_70844 [Ascoidea rubescens DSM 1968]